MARRLGLLIAAVVVAALGTSMVFLYVKGANERALANTRPQEVLVASTQVAVGTTVQDAASQGTFERKVLPGVAIADGALSNLNPIRDKVALTTIFPGQQVLRQMFGESADAATGPFNNLPSGTYAVSFSFAEPNRVGGFVQPGSTVAVFLAEEGADSARLLLPRARVVAVGPSTVSAGTGSSTADPDQRSRALLTLALTRPEAAKMIPASLTGTLYLGLLPNSPQVGTTAGINGAKPPD